MPEYARRLKRGEGPGVRILREDEFYPMMEGSCAEDVERYVLGGVVGHLDDGLVLEVFGPGAAEGKKVWKPVLDASCFKRIRI